jgi:phosphoenolpyruvate carboxykinase (ATP)
VETGQYTGRSPNDKFIVEEPSSKDRIWWGDVNQAFSEENYAQLRSKVLAYLQGRDLYIQDLYAGAEPSHQVSVQVISESAWHALFARTMLVLDLDPERMEGYFPEYRVLHAPFFRAIPDLDGTQSEVFVILNFAQKEILIGGTAYAGEIKKSVFSLMNDLLPGKGVLSMHCAANYGTDVDDVALFFGLSGTGKTTLSIDTTRTLVGDDEHGWGDNGVFNIEGGCYAKVIRISPEDEPEIFKTTRMFGTIIENVVMDRITRRMDLDDASITENTRAAFPISHLDNCSLEQSVGHPNHIFFLSADAFGVLPPLARLTPEQALKYFLLGYTAKVAGTERGVKTPQVAFSPCFGAPFMSRQPEVYARMLAEKVKAQNTKVWLINTGWVGGAYGVGNRISLPYTRALVQAAMTGSLDNAAFEQEPFFGLDIPLEVKGVPSEILNPKNGWANAEDYDQQAQALVKEFESHMAQFSSNIDT